MYFRFVRQRKICFCGAFIRLFTVSVSWFYLISYTMAAMENSMIKACLGSKVSHANGTIIYYSREIR